MTEPDDDDVTILHTSVVSSTATIPTPAPAPLELPGLPPAAIEALRSPPAGMYAYNVPVFQSTSPLARPQLLQRYLNFKPTDFFEWNTSVGLAWNAPSYSGVESLTSPGTPPPSTPEREDNTLLPIQPFGPIPDGIPSPPTPLSDAPLVLSLEDARSVDILAVTNGYQGRLINYESSTDTSCTLGTHDSERSGDWCEYQKGKKMGMDLLDPFIDDSLMDGAQGDSDNDIDAMLNDFKPL